MVFLARLLAVAHLTSSVAFCRLEAGFKFTIIVTQQEVLVPYVSMTTAGTPGQEISVELAV